MKPTTTIDDLRLRAERLLEAEAIETIEFAAERNWNYDKVRYRESFLLHFMYKLTEKSEWAHLREEAEKYL